jgi:hypothetical protein
MSFDWKDALRTIAPTAVSLLASPMAGGATKVILDAVLGDAQTGDPIADEAKLAGVLAGGITPEIRAKLIEADQALRSELIKAGVREKEIAADVEKAYIADTDKARAAHAQNVGVLRLGYLINAASYLTVAGVLYGCFALLGTRTGLTIDPGTAAMLGGVLGASVQWLMANAAQANGFFFGSSPGSRELAKDLGAAAATAVRSKKS